MKSLIALFAGFLMLAAPVLAQDGYRIRAGDTLRIEVLEDEGLNRSVLVAPDGRITLPLAGAVKAAGQSIEALQADLATRLAGSFAAPPNVYVSLERLYEPRIVPGGTSTPAKPVTVDVYLMGEVAKPGRIEVAPRTTVLQLFAEMGGFSKFAAIKRIQLRRMENGAEKIYTFNYRDIENGASNAGNTTVRDGDVVVVPQRKLFE
jgi:polysaccharide biosynthesis/export protein